FLMSRVREQYHKHFDPRRAVVEGVGSTAPVSTTDALIIISVVASFILDVDVTTKMFGVGLSVAVFLDVTLVRMVLVPAAMSLLGHPAWRPPARVERRLPVIDIEGGSHDGEEPLEPESQPESQPESESDRTPVLVSLQLHRRCARSSGNGRTGVCAPGPPDRLRSVHGGSPR